MELYLAWAVVGLCVVFGLAPVFGSLLTGDSSAGYTDCLKHGLSFLLFIALLGGLTALIFWAFDTVWADIAKP